MEEHRSVDPLIVVVVPSLKRGGAERVVSLLTQEWALTFRLVVVVFDGTEQAYEVGGDIVALNLPADGKSPLRRIANMARRTFALQALFRETNPRYVISFMESANFPSILAASTCRILSRVTVSVHNNPSAFGRVTRALMFLLYRLPQRTVVVSEGIHKSLVRMGLGHRRIHTIPNPVSIRTENFAPADGEKTPPYILAVGRLHKQKGFDLLIRAFKLANRPDLRLVILGEGNERGYLSDLARALGIAHRLELPGSVEGLEPWYRGAEFLVSSSRYEGFGNVLIEAMANGCPVVAFDCDFGPGEIIDSGISGILVPAGDVAALTGAINALLSDSQLRSRLSAQGLLRAEDFDVSRLAPLWIDGGPDASAVSGQSSS